MCIVFYSILYISLNSRVLGGATS